MDLKQIFKYFSYCYVNFLPIYLSISRVSLQVELQTHASWTRASVIISGDLLIINLKSPFQPLGQQPIRNKVETFLKLVGTQSDFSAALLLLMVIIEGLEICAHLQASGRTDMWQLHVMNCSFKHLRCQPSKRSVFLMISFQIGLL